MGLPDTRGPRRHVRCLTATLVALAAVASTTALGQRPDEDAVVTADLARVDALEARGRVRQALAILDALERRAPGRADVLLRHRAMLDGVAAGPRRLGPLVASCEAPRDRAATRVCALVLADAGDLGRAATYADRDAARYDPAASAVFAEIAEIARASGRADVATALAARAYALAPDDPLRVTTVARDRIRAGEPRAASALLEPLLVAFPDRDDTRVLAAEAAMLSGDHARAVSHYAARVPRCAPSDVPACLADLATAELYAGQLERAIETATRAAGLACAEDPRPHRVLGIALVRSGREAEARRAFDTSLARRDDPLTRALRRALDTP